ncbi:transmembrane and coiled-coil domain-containing protein 4-like protein, partial [Tanacetum coccineum]
IRSSFSKDVFDSHGYDISDYYDEIAFDLKEVLVVAGASSGLIQVSDLEETKGMCSYMHDAGIAMEMMKQDKARKLLAEVLVKGLQGNRPVTLISFSRGAREIFERIDNLAESNHAGIVERVVLGVPTAIQDENWIAARKVKIMLGYDDDDNGVRYDL